MTNYTSPQLIELETELYCEGAIGEEISTPIDPGDQPWG